MLGLQAEPSETHMGVVSTHIRVANPQDHARSREIELIEHTGATITKLPAELLYELHIEPQFSVPAMTSENREVVRSVGQAWISINGRAGIVPVTFRGPGRRLRWKLPRLENLGFAVDRMSKTYRETFMEK
jgi:predicted aspartyl protease